MATGTSGQLNEDAAKFLAVQQKYTEEAAKRFRPDGTAQFVNLRDASAGKFRALSEDPWVDHAALNAKEPVKDGSKYKFVILGAGYGALLYAVRLIQAGLTDGGPNDILFVDTAGGFGGTWYWNRYPGLHCDIESYTYMPLLEETGYVPKTKYSPGPALREHANRIAAQWNLADKALFRASVKSASWDEATRAWNLQVKESRGPGEGGRDLQIQAQYFLLAGGILSVPQVPKMPDLELFSGPIFHTARWDFSVSGGSPDDLTLTGLEGKRVGIIGTGATAIQVIPHLAKWAKEVYVFQRTPSHVHWRGQKDTDPEEWRNKIAHKKGWQHHRMQNLNMFLTNGAEDGTENLVNDAWSRLASYAAIIGSPKGGIIEPTPEKIGAHVGSMYQLDAQYTAKVRARVDEIVKNPATAAKLKAWYPTWCKRPTFSDEYLEAFNLPHVHLVDTDGKGIDAATQNGLVVANTTYPLDILVLSTGFRTPAYKSGSPASRADIAVYGRGGKSLDDKWLGQGAATLHGICTNGFPNLFFTGVAQTGQAANFVYTLDAGGQHIAHIIAAAEKKAGPGAVVEVTSEAEEAWSGQIMQRAAYFASVVGCTPGYITAEGEATKTTQDPLAMMKQARSSTWSEGMESFIKVLEAYRAEGDLKGLEITPLLAN
ncbi:pyridine nucleotide-disulfide oxidoreductase-like protein [Podospora didyma]|uniref:Pyridine nucleotide-disulfide oxidoreductase-like protein n=1 Tax=Podospora didyma TaxID=330526 RepID=A0AAE0N4H7_9PEZI|nr:pyridine nucleotide-disulfide oxidoreductase-like protein [Podospora didyma]